MSIEAVRWGHYEFQVYEPRTRWNKVGGLYIFAGRHSVPPGLPQWQAVYIGQTQDFSARLPAHEDWPAAEQLGATNIHILAEPQEWLRDLIEAELIEACQPRLNVQER